MADKCFSLFEGDSPTLQYIGEKGLKIYQDRELYQMYIHLLASALFPIFIGSHASLRRPPSAKAPSKSENADEDDDDLEKETSVEGLTPSDAIVFPILAGLTLGGLYFIIKVLKNAALLNKILGYYFSIIGVFGVGKLAADSLNVVTTFIFPSVWASGNTIYHVDPLLSQQVTSEAKNPRTHTHRKFVDKTNPFPGMASSLHFPERISKGLWSLRAQLKKHWIFRGYLHGIFSEKFKIQINDIIGFLLGLAAIILYNSTSKPWWLTNLIAFGFCYGTLQLMSPTTFWTGSLVLAGLFIYDITMVFYTPLMVTVATSLDVPIKLVFPGPKRGSMLGLGDVVLPGIMIAIALRFDLYLHYLRLQTHNPTPTSTAISTTTKPAITKQTYIPATSVWGERFWTSSAKHPSSPSDNQTIASGSRFKKTYFYTSIIGYIIGMLVTLIVLNVYNHAQPALLYLVPGVLISLWGTAFVRGEWALMWGYTEDGSLDDMEVEGEVKDGEAKDKDKEGKGKEGEGEHAHHVFLFSLSEAKGNRGLVPRKAKLFDKDS